MANRTSLFWRLMLAMSFVLLVGSACLAYVAHGYARSAADHAYDRLLLGAASQIAETMRMNGQELSAEIPASAFETLSNDGVERVFYKVADPFGRTISGYDDLVKPDPKPPSEAVIADAMFRGFAVRTLTIRQRLAATEANLLAVVTVAHTIGSRESLTRELTLRAGFLLAMISLLALLGTAMAARYALRPLHRIEDSLRARDPNDLTPLDEDVPAEISELAQSINHFMGRLTERMEAMQRFIANAAHQIRTPVAALGAQVDLLQHDTKPALRRQRVERIASRTMQIGRLVNQLLAQAVVIHRAGAMTQEDFDLRELLQQSAANAAGTRDDLPMQIAWDLPKSPQVLRGDPVSLSEGVRNVIENALQHGKATRIRISVEGRDGRHLIHIDDNGPGIPQQHWQTVLQPFSKVSEDGGTGLGLAIAAEAVRAHSGEIIFSRTDNGYFRVTLSLGSKETS